MNKADLVAAVAETAGLSRKDAESAIAAFQYEVIKAITEGDDIRLTGFGTFSQVTREAHTARNPRTGEAIPVAARKAPKFTPGAQFKDVVRGAATLDSAKERLVK